MVRQQRGSCGGEMRFAQPANLPTLFGPMAQGGGEIDARDKVAVVTGANTGIGRVTALELAERGARVLVLCRSEEKGTTAAAEIRKEANSERVEYVHLDLASMESVRRCAAEVLDRVSAIHLLVLNAGVASHPGLTEDGFEHTFGVNHLGAPRGLRGRRGRRSPRPQDTTSSHTSSSPPSNARRQPASSSCLPTCTGASSASASTTPAFASAPPR